MRLPFLPQLAGEEAANSELVDAARAGDVVKLQMALDRAATINYQNPFGETALMNAADAGEMETLKLLIAKGADLNILNKQKRSALFFATLMRKEAAGRFSDVAQPCGSK
ncbi:MAG TPA: ankyrin repeat domain-containing protein [Chthoniobacterales bacterium]